MRAIVFTVVLLLAACSDGAPRPLTEPEADRLAVMRFVGYRDRVVAFTGTVPAATGAIALEGRLDFVGHIGYGTMRANGSTRVLQWSPSTLAVLAAPTAVASDPPPAGEWQLRALRPVGSEVDPPLEVLLALGRDRPDNAQLLRQGSARWLRSDTVRGRSVDVFAGPAESSRLRYWIDEDARLLRLEAWFGNAGAAAVFDFTTGGKPITALPQLAAS